MAIPPIPDYCRVCGNLMFYWHASCEWRCGWCQPMLLRNVQFPTEAELRANKSYELAYKGGKALAPVLVGEPVATKPNH